MADIRDITEEQIFKTLGRGVPICSLLNEADANILKSNSIMEQVIKQVPEKDKGQIQGLELVLHRQKLNLESIRDTRQALGCK